MSDYSITTLFVVSNTTLATTGSTQNLLPGQLGIFDNAYVIGNSGTIAAKPYIYIAEGRTEVVPGEGSKRSDKIALTNVLEWYKVTANSNIPLQITTIGNFTFQCQQDITVTVVAHSSYLDTLYYNGLTASQTVTTACCNCGTAPCTTLANTDVQNWAYAMVAKLNADTRINPYLTFSVLGSGSTSSIVVQEIPLTKYGQPCDVAAFPYEWDRIWFRAFIIANAPTTQDFQVLNTCQQVGTVTINQRSLYDAGSDVQIQQLEKNFYSYQTAQNRALYRMGGFNEAFTSYVVAGTYYDVYYLKFMPYKTSPGATFTDVVGETETVIIAWPTGTAGSFETLANAYLGTVTDLSTTNPTTTTTTSTTSTSTTSTTTLFP